MASPLPARRVPVLFASAISVQAVALGAFALAPRPSPPTWPAIAALAAASAAFLAALALARRWPLTVGWALGAALALRLAALPLPPTLSNDLWRYLWDGRVAAHGFDPYRLAPDDPVLISLRGPDWDRMHHRSVPTVYPPLALTAFSIAARFPTPVAAWKTLVTLADLATCVALLTLARRRGVPLHQAGIYLWSPLPVLEIAGMGHLEGLGVAAVAATLVLLERRAVAGAAATAAAGALAKLAPLVAFPMWARQSGRPRRFLAVGLVLTATALAPVLAPGVPKGLATYAVSWEFAGPVYEPLWRAVRAGGVAEAVQGGIGRLEEATGDPDRFDAVYPWVYPQTVAKLLLALAAAAVVGRSLAFADPLRGTGWVFGGLLLASATVYPWYLLWVLPWAALLGSRAWLWTSTASLVVYLPGVADRPWPWLWAFLWLPFAVLWIRERPWTPA